MRKRRTPYIHGKPATRQSVLTCAQLLIELGLCPDVPSALLHYISGQKSERLDLSRELARVQMKIARCDANEQTAEALLEDLRKDLCQSQPGQLGSVLCALAQRDERE